MDREQTKLTQKMTVYGIVQGVGFRPLVFRLAQKHAVCGTVQNIGGMVEIIVSATEEKIMDFLTELQTIKSGGCEILKIELQTIENRSFDDFKIIESNTHGEVSIIPPDLSVCETCSRELNDSSDRRFQNAFISCMSCGPRYSILEDLPYDRENTTMQDFQMCHACRAEYTTPSDRRFHAQTISCNDCGPYLLMDGYENKEAFDQAVQVLKSGGIVAVKGIGGYHFACTPFLEETVLRLRKLKGREAKPFAVMFESIDSIKEYCQVSEQEKQLLKSNARPIVLLYFKNDTMAPSTCQGSIYCGAFLPYTPLQILLLQKCGPLIMTSANFSDQPIIKEDAEMRSVSSPYLNGVLSHKRRIVRSVDDSVTKIIDGAPQITRRSRGYVPYPVLLPKRNIQLFAAGGDLKSTFCLYKNGNAVVSQHFGDLQELTVLGEYQKSFEDLCRLLKVKPDLALCDSHPKYYSAKFAQTLGIPAVFVQHHHAHIASVMAEHLLTGRVIGVAFDGTGYGTDGNIWGGEFLICEGADYQRAAHLCNTLILGGDSSMKDAKKTETCFLLQSGLESFCSDDRKEVIKAAINQKINTVSSSSMGRLFDAVSSFLKIGYLNRYEGECAALLEKEAVLSLKNEAKYEKFAFSLEETDGIIQINPKPVFQALSACSGKISVGSLALSFHYAVADMILEVCERLKNNYHTNLVALSGGVFQNTVLTERVMKLLKENGFQGYINRAVPPNDGSISLGQAFIGLNLRGETV